MRQPVRKLAFVLGLILGAACSQELRGRPDKTVPAMPSEGSVQATGSPRQVGAAVLVQHAQLPDKALPDAVISDDASADDWTYLPMDSTRSVESPLIGGQRIIVGRPDGLWELAWWGQPLRRIHPAPVLFARRWSDELIITLNDKGLWKHDLQTGRSTRLARGPLALTCDGIRLRQSEHLNEWPVAIELDRAHSRSCLTLTDMGQGYYPRATGSIAIRMDGGGLEKACRKDDGVGLASGCSESDFPGDAASRGVSQPAELAPALYRVEDGVIERSARGIWSPVARVTRLSCGLTGSYIDVSKHLFGDDDPDVPRARISEDGRSPSGRWATIECGISILAPSRRLLFDRKTGRLSAVAGVSGSAAVSWLWPSDVLVVRRADQAGDRIVVPGVGSFRAGLVAW
jgi:hypothetical protein